MKKELSTEQNFALTLASAWHRLERTLDSNLGAIRGISLAEYRLMQALGDAPNSQASRVDLAHSVGLTPSGVTRALRPMEKLGMVATVKSKRDARLAIAALTPAGREVLDDASQIINDAVGAFLQRAPKAAADMNQLIELLDDLAQ